MCGIIGYTGKEKVRDVILDALELLEYRGYDSAGIAYGEKEGTVSVCKCAGRVADLRKKCGSLGQDATYGIGHTRWATHGGVCDLNAHPHQVGNVTLVHNGIIENYKELTKEYELEKELVSETDTEVAAALLNHFYKGNPDEAITKLVGVLKGTFALVMLFADQPGRIFSIRNVSPIVATYSEAGAMLASDVTALCRFTNRYFVVPEYHILELQQDSVRLSTLTGETVEPEYQVADWELNSSEKGAYPFYMEKEIMEQPDAIRATMEGRIVDGFPDFSKDGLPDSVLKNCERICVVACGTAMHAGLIAQSLVKSMLQMHIDVELASEFMYADPVVDEKTLVVAVSQSGETIDTLEALKYAKKKGATCMSILNVKGSSISRESDYVLYTNAGPEIAVASTKAYTTQLTVFYLLVAQIAYIRGKMSEDEVKSYIRDFEQVPAAVEQVLANKKQIHLVAKNVITAKDLFMIGRGLDYALLLEGSLKLKEVSYIHSEAYASGELKHGPIALITTDTPVVALITQEKLKQKELSNIKEVRSRGADVVLFIKESLQDSTTKEYETVALPNVRDAFMGIPASVALQLLAYYVSADKGYDVDKPRNLAKVVTVE